MLNALYQQWIIEGPPRYVGQLLTWPAAWADLDRIMIDVGFSPDHIVSMRAETAPVWLVHRGKRGLVTGSAAVGGEGKQLGMIREETGPEWTEQDLDEEVAPWQREEFSAVPLQSPSSVVVGQETHGKTQEKTPKPGEADAPAPEEEAPAEEAAASGEAAPPEVPADDEAAPEEGTAAVAPVTPLERAKDAAVSIPGCIGFAYNPKVGVRFLSQASFGQGGVLRDDNAWNTYTPDRPLVGTGVVSWGEIVNLFRDLVREEEDPFFRERRDLLGGYFGHYEAIPKSGTGEFAGTVAVDGSCKVLPDGMQWNEALYPEWSILRKGTTLRLRHDISGFAHILDGCTREEVRFLVSSIYSAWDNNDPSYHLFAARAAEYQKAAFSAHAVANQERQRDKQDALRSPVLAEGGSPEAEEAVEAIEPHAVPVTIGPPEAEDKLKEQEEATEAAEAAEAKEESAANEEAAAVEEVPDVSPDSGDFDPDWDDQTMAVAEIGESLLGIPALQWSEAKTAMLEAVLTQHPSLGCGEHPGEAAWLDVQHVLRDAVLEYEGWENYDEVRERREKERERETEGERAPLRVSCVRVPSAILCHDAHTY